MSETIREKAARYLTEGKVQVISANKETAVIKAAGSGTTPYVVTFSATGWECSCPASQHGKECAHIVAAKLISPLRNAEHVTLGNLDSQITEFLNQRLMTKE